MQQDRVPTTEEIRRLLSHMPVQGRALFTLQASAGTRIGETVELRLDDMSLGSDPPRAYLRPETTKSGDGRVVFFSVEAVEAIEEWLKVRDDYLESAYLEENDWIRDYSLSHLTMHPISGEEH
ncbi:MAG: tyrosine-type recombinase/integrase [Candidatus Thorarchaeota archaeon]